MKLELERKEVEKLLILITNRIDELRFDVNDDVEDNGEELRKVIREYKAIIKKINDQTGVK